MNKSFVGKCLLAAVILGASAAAQAGDIFVVANPGLDLAPADVRDVYLGEKQLAGSAKVSPVENAAAQSAFLEKVIKMDAGKYGSYWTKKTFRDGVNPPATKGSDSEVLAYVRSTPGAVGYVTAPSGDVKTVGKF